MSSKGLVASILMNNYVKFIENIEKYKQNKFEGDINDRYKDGYTALAAAAQNNNVYFYKTLLENGADPSIKTGKIIACQSIMLPLDGSHNCSYLTPYEIALKFGSYDVVDYINELHELEDELGLECSICLGEKDGIFMVLPACGHVFHKTCINKWKVTSRTCPLCRANFFGRRKRLSKRFSPK